MAETTVLVDPTLQISAFSRPLHLGMLYNARKDQLIPGIALWNVQDISDKTQITPQPNTRFQMAMSESLCERTNLLDLSASVKASFLCGLVQLEGSATFLREKTSSAHECRASLRYHVTTEVRELMISELGPPSPGVFDKTDATHVVIQALYGADALMEFQQTASDESEKQEIEGNLNVMINKIPSIEISGDGSVKMDDEDKEKVKNFSCTFFGDVNVTELPSTFEEAVKAYKELPSLLGEKQEKAVPVTVWLYPLSNFTSVESKFKRMISEALVSTAEQVMDDFHQAEIRTHDLLEKSREIKAEDIITKLKRFQTSLLAYTTEFVHKMAGLVPAIREGTMEESALTDLLKSQDASGFSQKDMGQWLGGKETEINTLTMHIKKLPDCQIKSEGSELDTFLMDPDVTDAFVFSFTSLKYDEPYLDKISQATEDLKTGPTTPAQMPTDEVPWYKTPGVKEALDSALSVFRNVTSQKKAISFISDPKYLGASVQWYQNAVLKDPHVEMQSLPLQACKLKSSCI